MKKPRQIILMNINKEEIKNLNIIKMMVIIMIIDNMKKKFIMNLTKMIAIKIDILEMRTLIISQIPYLLKQRNILQIMTTIQNKILNKNKYILIVIFNSLMINIISLKMTINLNKVIKEKIIKIKITQIDNTTTTTVKVTTRINTEVAININKNIKIPIIKEEMINTMIEIITKKKITITKNSTIEITNMMNNMNKLRSGMSDQLKWKLNQKTKNNKIKLRKMKRIITLLKTTKGKIIT